MTGKIQQQPSISLDRDQFYSSSSLLIIHFSLRVLIITILVHISDSWTTTNTYTALNLNARVVSPSKIHRQRMKESCMIMGDSKIKTENLRTAVDAASRTLFSSSLSTCSRIVNSRSPSQNISKNKKLSKKERKRKSKSISNVENTTKYTEGNESDFDSSRSTKQREESIDIEGEKEIHFTPILEGHNDKIMLMGSCFSTAIGERMLQNKLDVCVNPMGMGYNAISIARQLNKMVTGSTMTSIEANGGIRYSKASQPEAKAKERKQDEEIKDNLYKLEEIQKSYDFFPKQTQKDDTYYFSFDHDTSFTSYLSSEDCLQRINYKYQSSSKFLKSCNFLFITLGTSYGYELIEQDASDSTNSSSIRSYHNNREKLSVLLDEENKKELQIKYNPDKIVTNCHRLPHTANFNKVLIENEVATLVLSQALIRLIKINPSITIFLTVSPIRHTKEGMIENSRSKAELLITAHNVCNRVNNFFDKMRKEEQDINEQYGRNKRNIHYCFYFPSYEILMDDLRDYRFYEEDLIHPSSRAVDYIYQQLQKCLYDQRPKSLFIREKILRIQKAVQHRPRSYNSGPDGTNYLTKEHESFIRNFLKEIDEIEEEIPSLKGRFENEKNLLNHQLKV